MSLEAAAMEEAFVLDFIELLNPERPAGRIKTAGLMSSQGRITLECDTDFQMVVVTKNSESAEKPRFFRFTIMASPAWVKAGEKVHYQLYCASMERTGTWLDGSVFGFE
jgi:hypothetical protein